MIRPKLPLKIYRYRILMVVVLCWNIPNFAATAADIFISNQIQLVNALQNAGPGDNLLLQPGTYSGGLSRSGLQNVTIRSVDPNNRAVISGGNENLKLSAAQQVTLQDLIFEDANSNGINIDDGGGDFSTPSTNITLRRITVRRDVANSGNLDGIKFAGVRNFLLDQVEVFNWGTGGNAVDMVGAHHGLIQNSYFKHDTGGAAAVRPKGGSKDITIRANRIEMPSNAGRGIQAGGSTGTQYFRFLPGESGYEADDIVVEGNVIDGADASFSFVNIDGGVFHHNFAYRPGSWNVRILNENSGKPIVDTQGGSLLDNQFVFNDTPTEYNRAVNIGSETLPETFTFERNQWYNQANPTVGGSTPNLPVPEIDGVYGVDLGGPDGVKAWEFDWGIWLVNASTQSESFQVTDPQSFSLASPGIGASEFLPLEVDPFSGNWFFTSLAGGTLNLAPFSQIMLSNSPVGTGGDSDGDGDVDGADFLAWQRGYGSNPNASPADGDFDGNGTVESADLAIWQNNYGQPATPQVGRIPEPTAVVLLAIGSFCSSGRGSWCSRKKKLKSKF